MNRNENIPQQIAADLYHRKIQSVIIEGGAYTLNQFIAAGLWDEARIFTSRFILTSGIQAPHVDGMEYRKDETHDDTLVIKLNSSL